MYVPHLLYLLLCCRGGKQSVIRIFQHFIFIHHKTSFHSVVYIYDSTTHKKYQDKIKKVLKKNYSSDIIIRSSIQVTKGTDQI